MGGGEVVKENGNRKDKKRDKTEKK